MSRLFLRSIYPLYQWLIFMPILIVDTVTIGLIVILTAPFPMRTASFYMALIWARVIGWVTPVTVRVEGKEQIKKDRSYVVIANHQSFFDIPVIYGWSGLDLKFIMKKELKRIPLFGQACAAKGHVFVDRSDRQKAIDSLNSSVQDLHHTESVIIFPEGTRSRNGEVQRFRKGAFRLALATGIPILPISVAGTERVQPPDTLRLYPGRTGMRVHEPIEVDGMDETDLDELIERSRDKIVQGKKELEEELGLK